MKIIFMHLGVPKFIIELKLSIKQNPKRLVSLSKHKTSGNFLTISAVHPRLMFLVFWGGKVMNFVKFGTGKPNTGS